MPPKLPRSVIVPFCQRNGCVVGIPVLGFGVESVYENPATCPALLIKLAKASGPPNVPKSCMNPSCHKNARVWVPLEET